MFTSNQFEVFRKPIFFLKVFRKPDKVFFSEAISMEKITNKTQALIDSLNTQVGYDFIAYISFVEFYIRTNPLGDDLGDLERDWFTSLEYPMDSLNQLINYSKYFRGLEDFRHPIIADIFEDAESVCSFSLQDVAYHNSDFTKDVQEFFKCTSTEELRLVALSYFDVVASKMESTMTSVSVSNLINALLDIQSDDAVADFCSGSGGFLRTVASTYKKFGFEINYNTIKRAMLLNILNESVPAFIQQDVLTLDTTTKFDKIYCEYPWGMIYTRPLQTLGSEKWKPLPIKDIKRSMTSWLFISKVLSALKKNGVAIVHANEGALFSTYEKEIRQYAIEQGLIKAIIKMPRKVNEYADVQTSLIVLSYDNETIKFIDASNLGEASKNKCVLSNDDIQLIKGMLDGSIDSKNVIELDNKVLEETGYLAVDKYLREQTSPLEIKDGKTIGDIASVILRSAINSSSHITDNPATGIRVLSSADIKDGVVRATDLPYIAQMAMEVLPKNWKDLVLCDGDVVITNKSTTIKSTVIDTEGETIVLFGSLYGIRLKEELMRPLYLSTFFNSTAGQLALQKIQTGTVISMITLANLKSLVVPCPSLLIQDNLCGSVLITLEMISESKERVKKLQKTYEASFDDLLVD